MLIMENFEEVMQILERYTKLKQKDIPKELEDYLCYVAKTGDTVYRWASIKYLFREKLMHVIKEFHESTPSVDDLPQYPNVDPFNYETMKSALLERLELFNAAPFTVQRLCELLTDPRKQYSRIDKYMRALEKNILVVSTIEPGRKQADSENGDSLDSVVNGDLSLDVNVEIDMENESIFNIESSNASSSTTSKSDDDQVAPKKPKLESEEPSNIHDTSSINTDSATEDTKIGIREEEIQKEEEEEESSSSSSGSSKESVEQEEISSNPEIKENRNESNEDVPDVSNTDKQDIKIQPSTTEIKKLDSENIANQDNTKVKECTAEEPINLKDTNNPSALEDSTEENQSKHSGEDVEQKRTDSVPTATEVLSTVSDSASELSKQEKSEDEIQHTPKISESPSIQSSEPLHKTSEQMAVEETATILPECSSCLPAVSSELAQSTDISEQQIPDQPMDENVDSTISSSCTTEASCLNEVVMQSESEMATDLEPIKLGDDKTDLSGMDVDDTSQEEAMDQ